MSDKVRKEKQISKARESRFSTITLGFSERSQTGLRRTPIYVTGSEATGRNKAKFLLSLYSEGKSTSALLSRPLLDPLAPRLYYMLLRLTHYIPRTLPFTRSFSIMSPTSCSPPSGCSSQAPSTLSLATSFILSQLSHHRSSKEKDRALVIGIQGPQGSGKRSLLLHPSSSISHSPLLSLESSLGKSHLANQLIRTPELSHLKLANLSLDDLYLSHQRLEDLAKTNPSNPLLSGRGQAGTHDLKLGIKVLKELKGSKEGSQIKIPVFEKSLFGGQGDRLSESEWVSVEGKVDVVIFEGWMLGFHSISNERLEELCKLSRKQAKKELRLDYDEAFYLGLKEESLRVVNEGLRGYEQGLWKEIDTFLELRPERMGYVWEWRLEVSELGSLLWNRRLEGDGIGSEEGNGEEEMKERVCTRFHAEAKPPLFLLEVSAVADANYALFDPLIARAQHEVEEWRDWNDG